MSDEELSESARETKDAWFDHPLTHRVARGLDEEAEAALKKLFGAARGSSDANVRGYMAQYESLKRAAASMRQEKT